MTHDEMIERVAACIWQRVKAPGHVPWERLNGHIKEIVESDARVTLDTVRAAGFEVVARDERGELRAHKIPPGWVCVDPEGPLAPHPLEQASDCVCVWDLDCPDDYHYDIRGVGDAIRAYLRALRDQQKGAGG